MKIAFLGLGIMGFNMAKHLQKNHEVLVWNRNSEKTIKFGQPVLSLQETVQNADFIIMCLGDDKSVENIVNQVLLFAKKDAIFIDHTTISAETTKKLATKCTFLDAPVTGGQGGAEAGTLAILCGGKKEVFEKCKPIMQSYGKNIEYFGKSGNGQIAKMANQICIAGIIQSLAESVNFAKKSGIDAEKLYKTIGQGAGSSWQMNNRANWMIDGNFESNKGFPVEWMIKDLNICLDEATKIGADLPLTYAINEKYKQIENKRIDTSSLILLLNKN